MKSSHLLPVLPAILFASTAHAVQSPAIIGDRTIEPARGPRARLARTVSSTAPSAAQALDRFRSHYAGWQVLWDRDTGVPTRLWGRGIPAPGASANAAAAERLARDVLAAELALLAPGARLDDLVVERNQVRAGVRTVWFAQRWRGLAVLDAGVRFTFKDDRLVAIGSTASPDIAAAMPARLIDAGTATAAASAWIERSLGIAPRALDTAAPVVLPLVRRGAPAAAPTGAIEHHVVVPVRLDSASPRAEWTVWVDATTGEPVARRQDLLFASGTVRYHVPDRYPQHGYVDRPAAFTIHSVDGTGSLSDGAGLVTWATSVASSIVPGLTGTFVSVTTASGTAATATLSLEPDGTVVWDGSANQLDDAQIAALVFANDAKQYALTTLDPDLAWLHQAIPVQVNETDDTCNAYSNLDDIHFFVEANGCANTGRLADVVYHEFGHSLHAHALGSTGINSALSEGISDYYAATITGDHGMGKGFFLDRPDTALRDLDPADREYNWPDDVVADPHVTGLIIGSALWDLRKRAIAAMGAADGVAFADDVFYGVISRADDIPSSYVEAVVTDDDDGDPSNGSPHECLLLQAFGAHGLVTGQHAGFGQIPPVVVDGAAVTLTQPTEVAGCPSGALIESAHLVWHVRGDTATGGTIPFAGSAQQLTAQVPTQPDGTLVQFQVTYTRADGLITQLPANAADPWYEAYFGPVTPIYCTDFERDPVADGWTLSGFQWGTPSATAGTTDPTVAFSGATVLGTVLGDDYAPDQTYRATSPSIDVRGYTGVRVQYRRWLTAEDYFYDQTSIAADGTELWHPIEGDGGLNMTDREWRFQDLDLSAQAADGMVSVSVGLVSDPGVQFGGWTIDDFCVVATGGSGVCGNGVVDAGEACDDGNTADGDDCSATCELPDGSTGDDGGCCSTSAGGAGGPALLGLATVATILRRRRRRT